MCVNCEALYTQYFPQPCEKTNPQAYYSNGIQTHNLAMLEQMSHQQRQLKSYTLAAGIAPILINVEYG